MSYRSSLNGNDIRWDYVNIYNPVCPTCEEHIGELIESIGGEHYYPCGYEDANGEPCPVCEFLDSDHCEGHTIVYSGEGYKMYHDSNDNFVGFSDDTEVSVMMTILDTDYLKDALEDEYYFHRDEAIQELRDRGEDVSEYETGE